MSTSWTRLFVAAVLAVTSLPSIAVAADEIFVSDYATNKISVFLQTANGDFTPIRTIQTEVQHPHGIRIDTVRQELFVPLNLANAVKVYDANASFPGNDAPKRTIAGDLTLISRPVGTAIDTVHQELYVTNDVVGASFITVFPLSGSGNIAPIRTLGGPLTGIDGPNGIMVDLVHDELYIVSYRTGFGGSITVFPRTASGNVAPTRTIQGPNTSFSKPQEIGLDLTNDELIVGNSAFATPSAGSVLVFSRLDVGNVNPLRQISGPSTQLCTPVGLWLDLVNNEIVVANANFHDTPCPASVTVYGRTASGDAPPLRQIGPGPLSAFTEPVSVTVRRRVDCSVSVDGTSCDDGNPCTQTDTCHAGVCNGANPVTCTASDQCHVAGVCDTGTGACSNPAKANGTTCNDNNACTQTDACQSGVCTGGSPVVCAASDLCHLPGTCDTGTGICGVGGPVVCTASDSCHNAGVCDLATGACSNPAKPDGSACNDGNTCTSGETCQAGTCGGGTTLCSGLVAEYRFDEGAGPSVSDSSGSGNTGTIDGATWTTSGKYGDALYFNGTDAMVTVNDSPSLDLTVGMTLEAWVNPSVATTHFEDVIYKGTDDIYFLEGSSDPSGWPATGGTFSGGPMYGTAALPPNAWSHLAATYDGASLVLYVGGAQVASRAVTGAIPTSTGPLTLGGDPLYGQHWAGLIDEVRIYGRALGVNEILESMAAPDVCGIRGGSLRVAADKQTISWTSTVVFGPFDLVKGDLGLLRSSGGNFTGASCMLNNVMTTTTTDSAAIAPGSGVYYLTRCDGGTWGDQTQVGNRGTTLTACP
jgi:concanavalin A-like lectin/glucanase superfamily protein